MPLSLQFTVLVDTDGPSIAPVFPLPNAVDVSATAILLFRITDVSGVDLSTVIFRLNGQTLYSGSSAQNGATVTVTVIDDGYDFAILPPEPTVDGQPQQVYIAASDTVPNASELLYTYYTGMRPRLIGVANTAPGILVVRFNENMILDDVFRRTQNFVVTPLGNSPEVTVLEVLTNASQADAATLVFEGGGSPYLLTVNGVLDLAGNSIDPEYNSLAFELSMPGGEIAPTVHIFETVFGPIGIAQTAISRRTVDAMVVNRSLDVGMREQLKHRLKSIGASTPLRSGKPGGRRA